MSMTEMKTAEVVIYRSENGRDGWTPILPADVPAWVTHPDNMARMLDGEECMKADEGEDGSDWYRALRWEDVQAMQAAEAKRERRAEKRRATLH